MSAKSRPINRRGVLTLGGAALLLAQPAIARTATEVSRLSGQAFGTGWRITMPAGIETPGLAQRLGQLFDGIDRAFSPWRADSALSHFNESNAGDFAASPEVVEVAASALAIAEASGGLFDPTVGPLVARWGFGPIRVGESQPGGWRRLSAAGARLSKQENGMTLDLCGIAKGHALDRMVSLMMSSGHDSFLIDIGGELAARGRHPSGRVWQVGIEDPRMEVDDLAGVLLLDGMAVATSGDRANGYDLGGRRYSHIIDPATSEPVAGALASVSVLMSVAREADGWATALMAAGEDGPVLAESLGISALFLFRDGEGLRRVATGAFHRHLV